MEDFLRFFAIGSAGAIAVQLITLREQYGKLPERKFRGMIKSRLFWFVTLGLVFSSGLVAWAVHVGSEAPRVFDVFVSGIAARSIVGGSIGASVHNQGKTAGKPNSDEEVGAQSQEELQMSASLPVPSLRTIFT